MRGRGSTICHNRRTTAAWKYIKSTSRGRYEAGKFALDEALDEVLQHKPRNVAFYIFDFWMGVTWRRDDEFNCLAVAMKAQLSWSQSAIWDRGLRTCWGQSNTTGEHQANPPYWKRFLEQLRKTKELTEWQWDGENSTASCAHPQPPTDHRQGRDLKRWKGQERVAWREE